MKRLHLWRAKVAYASGMYYDFNKTTSEQKEQVAHLALASDSVSQLKEEVEKRFRGGVSHPYWTSVNSITEISYLGEVLVEEVEGEAAAPFGL